MSTREYNAFGVVCYIGGMALSATIGNDWSALDSGEAHCPTTNHPTDQASVWDADMTFFIFHRVRAIEALIEFILTE